MLIVDMLAHSNLNTSAGRTDIKQAISLIFYNLYTSQRYYTNILENKIRTMITESTSKLSISENSKK